MQLSSYLAVLAAVLPVVYGAPAPLADSLHPEILAAMKRDLGLDEVQATRRVARELWAANTIEQIQTTTGDAFAGAWMAEDGNTLTVGITNAAAAAEVSAVGAVPVIVATSLAKLQAAKDALDARNTRNNSASLTTLEAPATGIAAYWVDVVANKIVFEALGASKAEAEALAVEVGLEASEFEVRTVEVMPTTLATVQGGVAYLINNSARCSVGFSVTTGFVSAGHCGSVGSSATTSSGASLGTFSGKVFPGSADMSYIKTVSGTTLSGVVYAYGGTNIAVKGSTASAVGSSICRSGSTSGVHCGTVGALGATVNYSQGSVTGLTRTSVCAEPGDSGGSFYTGGQAQGVTSGGSGDCTSGGTTYFQPVNEILSTYGLKLVTS